jgi:hypothetical protein
MWVMVLFPGCIFLLLLERPMVTVLCIESILQEDLRRLLVRVNRLLSRFNTRDNISSMLKSIM